MHNEKPSTGSSADIPVDAPDVGDDNAHYRLILNRLNALDDRVKHVSSPPAFRLADALNLIGVLIAVAVFIFSAFSLADRISKTDDRITHVEDKLGVKIDAVSDKLTTMDERMSRMEGGQDPNRTAPRHRP
jgi:uncharacterized protein YdcH (DUF465 family)